MLKWLMILLLVSKNEGSRILLVFPTPVRSHDILGFALVKRLLDAQHEVTFVTPFPRNNSHRNLTLIDVSAETVVYPMFPLETLIMEPYKATENHSYTFDMTIEISRLILLSTSFRTIMLDPKENFDLVLTEWTFVETYMGLAIVFDCPLIWFLPSAPGTTLLQLLEHKSNLYSKPPWFLKKPSFLSLISGISYRSISMLMTLIRHDVQSELYYSLYEPIMSRKGRYLPTYSEIFLNVSLVLVNYQNYFDDSAQKLPEMVKLIGGYHMDSVEELLPKNLQDIMNNAINGVVYFSIGSNLESNDIPREIKRYLLKVFAKYSQVVIWKMDCELPSQMRIPSNVHLLKWVSQRSVLAHPNCKIFITHGGISSLTESIYYGVPIIGIPVYGDQMRNVNKAVENGIGLLVEMTLSIAKDLEIALLEILCNSRYSTKAKELSKKYHDRKILNDDLVQWIEKVIISRGPEVQMSPPKVVDILTWCTIKLQSVPLFAMPCYLLIRIILLFFYI